MTTEHRTREDDVIDTRITRDAFARRVVAIERLHEIRGRTGFGECAREMHSAERAARRVLHDHCVARNKRQRPPHRPRP